MDRPEPVAPKPAWIDSGARLASYSASYSKDIIGGAGGKMEYRIFGRTGLKVSRFCLGTMSIGTSKWKGWVQDEAASVPILEKALALGINFFDMADWYSAGVNEEIVGRHLLQRAPRDNLVLLTKVHYPITDDPNDRGLSRKHILASIDRSLRRIGTDHVDIYMIHAFDGETPIEETMRALDDVVRSGKARYLGASTMYAWQFAKMNHVAERNGWTRFSFMQCQYSLLYREEEREMMPYCRDAGIGVMSFSPLARGILSGKKSVRSTEDPYVDQFFGDEIDQAIAGRVAEVARRRGVEPATVAMSWVAHSGNVDVPMIGADGAAQVETAVRAAEFVLSDEDRLHLEALYRPRDMINDENPVRRPRAVPRG